MEKSVVNNKKKVVCSVIDLWNAYLKASHENHPIADTLYCCWTGKQKYDYLYDIENGCYIFNCGEEVGSYLKENLVLSAKEESYGLNKLGLSYLCAYLNNNQEIAKKIRLVMLKVYQLAISNDLEKQEKIEVVYHSVYEDTELANFVKKHHDIEKLVDEKEQKSNELFKSKVIEKDPKEYVKAA